jgi:hypothetical protein
MVGRPKSIASAGWGSGSDSPSQSARSADRRRPRSVRLRRRHSRRQTCRYSGGDHAVPRGSPSIPTTQAWSKSDPSAALLSASTPLRERGFRHGDVLVVASRQGGTRVSVDSIKVHTVRAVSAAADVGGVHGSNPAPHTR